MVVSPAVKAPQGKRDDIVVSAAHLFAEKGYATCRIAEIAQRAGIGKGTIYEYFRSKEEIFIAVFRWYLNQCDLEARASISGLGGSVAFRLSTLGDRVMRTIVDLKDLYGLTLEFWAASGSPQLRERLRQEFRQAYRGFRSLVASLITEGVGRGEFRAGIDPEAVAAALVGAWDALGLQYWFDPTFDPRRAARRFMSVVLRGLSSGGDPTDTAHSS